MRDVTIPNLKMDVLIDATRRDAYRERLLARRVLSGPCYSRHDGRERLLMRMPSAFVGDLLIQQLNQTLDAAPGFLRCVDPRWQRAILCCPDAPGLPLSARGSH
jgi:hypothetical protein